MKEQILFDLIAVHGPGDDDDQQQGPVELQIAAPLFAGSGPGDEDDQESDSPLRFAAVLGMTVIMSGIRLSR